jgi:hypothetical protein
VTVAAASSNPTSVGRGATPASSEGAQLAPQRVAGGDACPLCGTPLRPDQDWCLRCGAAARTRLAATPSWKTPIATIAVVAALALGVLAAALVKLAGGSSSSSAPSTTTVTTPAASAPATPTTPTTLPGAGAPPASTTTPSTPPGSSTATSGASAPATPTSTSGVGAGGAGANSGGKGIKLTPAEREALRKFKLGGAAK